MLSQDRVTYLCIQTPSRERHPSPASQADNQPGSQPASQPGSHEASKPASQVVSEEASKAAHRGSQPVTKPEHYVVNVIYMLAVPGA